MRSFVFKYENILKMRQDTEEEEKNKLGILNGQLAVLENNLFQAIDNRDKYFDEIELLLKSGCKASELRNIQTDKKYHDDLIQSIKRKIDNKKQDIERQLKIYVEAVKERKIMEKLKEKQQAEFNEEFNKAEERVVEEIVNYKNFKMSGD